MSTRSWMILLVVVVAAATFANVAVFMGRNNAPPLFVAKPPIVKHPHTPPAPRPVTPLPVAQPQAMPGPSTGAVAAQAWWPKPLNPEQAARRAAADAMLMRSERLDDNAPANVKALQSNLIDQRYDDVEKKLDDMLAKSIADPVYDFVERDTSSFVDGSSNRGNYVPKLEGPVVDAWVKARPKSAWAHYSAGLRLLDQASDARGDGFADKISDEHWARMHRFAVEGRVELKKALALNPKIYMVRVCLMDLDMMDAQSGNSVWQDYIEGLKQRPYTYMLADQAESAAEPRWGGDYGAMDAVAANTDGKLDHNPRFWELHGSAAADRANVAKCMNCGLVSWSVALREYNAALAYSDRPYLLADAAEAAIHLQRYAVAYRYYERASAYEPSLLRWKGEMGVLQALCDPKWSRQKFEILWQESVQYGMADDRDYPRVPGDCAYHQAELPWGDEPLPTTTGMLAYNVDPEHDPIFQPEPRPVSFPKQSQKLASPDGSLAVLEADAVDTSVHQLRLLETATGRTIHLYSYLSAAGVVFNSSGKRLIVQDQAPRMDNTCLVFDLAHQASHVDLLAEFNGRLASKDPSLKGFKLGVSCSFFWNDDVLTFGVSGYNPETHASADGMYRYDAATDTISPYSDRSVIQIRTP